MALTYTYDLTTAIGKVRLNASDTGVGATAALQGSAIWANEELQVFLDQGNGDPLMGAANALYALAGNRAKLAQHAQMGDGTSQDLTQLAGAIIKAADALRDEATRKPASVLQGITYDDFSFRREVENVALRQSGST